MPLSSRISSMARLKRNANMYLKNVTPLIVVRRQRAGTRYLTEVLNSFDDVTIQGEIPNPVMRSLVKFIQESEKYYRGAAKWENPRRVREYQAWTEKKRDLIYAMWANTTQSRRLNPSPDCRYYGYKRPNNEFYFDFYEKHLADQKAVYVYCVRNFVDNYLSISSRWPDRTIEMVADDYLKSVEHYRKIKQAAPDRVLLFNLDDHIKYGFGYLDKNIIEKLDLDLKEDLRTYLAGMGAKNQTVNVSANPRREALTNEEEAYLLSRPALHTEFQKLCCDQSG